MREPTLSSLIVDAIRARLLDVHVMLPGKIVSYSATDNTVEVELLLLDQRPQLDGTVLAEAFPLLQDVPVAFQRCAGGWLTWPLVADDTGMVIFADNSLSVWNGTVQGQVVNPKDTTKHNLSGAVFVPGLAPAKSPIASPSTEHPVIHTETELHLGEKSLSADQFAAVSKLVADELDKIKNAFNSHTHTTALGACAAGGATGAIASSAGPVYTPASVAATKVKVK